jgi:putative addiction module component (TIGR02574 family)
MADRKNNPKFHAEDEEAETDTALDETQSAELDRRMAEYERDPTAVVPWEQVKADLFKR